jgi:transcriptional regulator GlxA family with amidase domain
MSCLAALLGDQPQRSLAFSSEMDLSKGHGQSIAQHILLAVRDLDQPGLGIWNEATMNAFQHFIVTSLLMSQPHNFSEALARLDKHVMTREVKRAIDFIHANLDMPITIKDIIDVTGVPGRTLFKHFRDYQGISPMQYLRNARFDRVRRALLAAETHASVTMIAMEAGFMHLGRFAVEYRQRFGESPSETLRRRKS